MEQLTLFPEDSHASRTAQLESEKEKRMNAICGPTCLKQLNQFGHVGSWAKTFSALLIGQTGWYSMRCKLTWKLRGTRFGRMYCQLRPSMLPIEGTGFGLLPTPLTITGGAHKVTGMKRESSFSANLNDLAKSGMLPTPCRFDYNSARTPEKWKIDKAKYAEQGVNLQMGLKQMAKFQMLPTPTLNEGKNTTFPESQKNRSSLIGHLMNEYPTGKDSHLSPQFVAEMMGFPTDWTLLPFQNGETNQ